LPPLSSELLPQPPIGATLPRPSFPFGPTFDCDRHPTPRSLQFPAAPDKLELRFIEN
jgi:hypothetical protein